MPKRKREAKPQEDYNESDSDSQGIDFMNPNDSKEIINVEFEFVDPKEDHFHSLKNLLNKYLVGEAEKFSISEISDLIVNQPIIGTMLTVSESNDVYGFVTALAINNQVESFFYYCRLPIQ